jgi:Domain of unknown function (DUF397)
MSAEQAVNPRLPEWRKSSYSGSGGGDCVEVAAVLGAVHVRDSKDRSGPNLDFPEGEWAAFVAYVRDTAV